MVQIHQIYHAEFNRYSELLDLLREAFAYMEGRIDPPSSLSKLNQEKLTKKVRDELLFVALEGDEIVGCVFARPDDDYVYLGKLAVKTAYRGRGLSRRLVERVEHLARHAGLSEVEIETRVELIENQSLFEHFGYQKTAENSHDGYDRPTSYCYRKCV